jgi:hypothetical protein
MRLRSLVVLAIVSLQIGACTANSTNPSAVTELDRRHEELMKTMPGGGGGGGGAM